MKIKYLVPLVSLVLLAGCSQNSSSQGGDNSNSQAVATPITDTNTPAPVSSSDQTATESVALTGKEVAVAITAQNYSFSKKEIKAKLGDKVKVTLTNNEGMHDFNIDEMKVNSGKLKAGDSKVVEFVASKKGTFEYYCSVGNHRAMGMVGKLIVE
jgi:plastocyanin